MTTIAYKDGILAADSRETRGEVIDNDIAKKLYRLPDGSVVGTAGKTGHGIKMVMRLEANAKIAVKKEKPLELPEARMKCQLLLVTKDGLYVYESGEWEPILTDFYAIGTGAPYATVAMEYGAAAKQAVISAIGKDIYSGGKVRSMEV